MVITIRAVEVMFIKFNSQIVCIKVCLYFQASWRCGLIKSKRVMNCVCKLIKFTERPKMRQDDRMDLKGQTLVMLMIVIFLIMIMVMMMIIQNQNVRQNILQIQHATFVPNRFHSFGVTDWTQLTVLVFCECIFISHQKY